MELLLNLFWLAIAVAGFTLVPKRSGQVWLVLACLAALLFPIISVSDDINAPWVFVDAATAPVVAIALFSVAFVALARLRKFPPLVYATHVVILSDPRSPPTR